MTMCDCVRVPRSITALGLLLSVTACLAQSPPQYPALHSFALHPLFARYADEREAREGFGDFLLRSGVVKSAASIAVENTP